MKGRVDRDERVNGGSGDDGIAMFIDLNASNSFFAAKGNFPKCKGGECGEIGKLVASCLAYKG